MLKVTASESTKLLAKLKSYSKAYLVKKYETLDESATRIMINNFLTEVLGFEQLVDIRTEYAIKGTFADYVIQLNRKKHLVVEVKAIQIDLSENHLRQALGYATNEGIDWILLTNGKQFELYRVLFTKPIACKKLFTFDLSKPEELKASVEYFNLITKKYIMNGSLNNFWAKFQSLEPISLAKYLYSPEVIKFLKKTLRTKSGIAFSEEDIIESVYKIIVEKIPSQKPRPITKIKLVRKLDDYVAPSVQIVKPEKLTSTDKA